VGRLEDFETRREDFEVCGTCAIAVAAREGRGGGIGKANHSFDLNTIQGGRKVRARQLATLINVIVPPLQTLSTTLRRVRLRSVTSVDHSFGVWKMKMSSSLWLLLVLGVVLPRHTTVGSLASGGPAGGDVAGPVSLPIPRGANLRERMVAVGGRGGWCGQCARLRGGGVDPSLEEKAGQDLDNIYDSIRFDGHPP
jgi:hypothetical protein